MFEISAPLPSVQTTSILPNPLFSDGEGLTDTVARRRSMNGKRRTYVKTKNGRRKLQWTFRLTRNKGLEVRAFLNSYFASQIRVVDHNGRKWKGYFTGNPFEFDTPNKAGPAQPPYNVGEQQNITLEFQGVEDA